MARKVVLIGMTGDVNLSLMEHLSGLRGAACEAHSFRQTVDTQGSNLPLDADVYVIGGRLGTFEDDIKQIAEYLMLSTSGPRAIIDLTATHRHEPAWTCVARPDDFAKAIEAQRSLGGLLLLTQPGCMATAGILALQPLVEDGLLPDTERLYLDVTTGTSTGGQSLKKRFQDECIQQSNHSMEHEHDHVSEIRQALGIGNSIIMIPKVVERERNINLLVHVPSVSFDQANAAYIKHSDDYRGLRLHPASPVKKLHEGMLFLSAICAYWPAPNGEGVMVQVVMDNILRGSVLPAYDLIQEALEYVSSPQTYTVAEQRDGLVFR